MGETHVDAARDAHAGVDDSACGGQRRAAARMCSAACLTILIACGAWADTFFDSVFYDTGGLRIPPASNTAALASFLTMNPDVFVHAQAVVIACGISNNAEGAALFARRLDEDAGDPLRMFDAALARVARGCADANDAAIGDGLEALKTVCADTSNPGMWLAYAMCLANVDIFQIGRSRYRVSPMKDAAMHAVRRAVELDMRYPHRGFALSFQSVLEYMALCPAYKPFCTEMRAKTPARRKPILEYMNGMLVIRAAHPLAGRGCLAAALGRRVWLLNLDEWRIVARADNVENYSLAADGSLLAARVDGSLLTWRTTNGRMAARVPRVATWDIMGDGSLACVANPFAPLNSYDLDLVRLDGGMTAATLARRFDQNIAVHSVAVTRDGAYAAVNYRPTDHDGMVDVWDVTRSVRVGSRPHSPGRCARFSPDGRYLVQDAPDGAFYFLDLPRMQGASEAAWFSNKTDLVVMPETASPHYAFLAGGALFLCWSSTKSACDGFEMFDLRSGGSRVTIQYPTNGFDGVAIAEDGNGLITWRGAALAAWRVDGGAIRPVFETTLHARVTAAVCAPAAPLVAAATDDGQIHVWQLDDARPRPLVPLATGDRGITMLAFETSAHWLAAHNASNQQVYVGLLRQGGMFDGSAVLGWESLAAPPIGVVQATTTNAPLAPAASTNNPPAPDTPLRSQ